MRVAPPIELSPEERKELEQIARARSLPAREVERAGIVLRAADGWLDKDIAAELDIMPEKAARWHDQHGGVTADAPQKAAGLGAPRKSAELGGVHDRSTHPDRVSAIDDNCRPGHVAGRVTQQKHDYLRHLLRSPPPAEGYARRQPVPRVCGIGPCHRGLDKAGRHRVHPDSSPA